MLGDRRAAARRRNRGCSAHPTGLAWTRESAAEERAARGVQRRGIGRRPSLRRARSSRRDHHASSRLLSSSTVIAVGLARARRVRGGRSTGRRRRQPQHHPSRQLAEGRDGRPRVLERRAGTREAPRPRVRGALLRLPDPRHLRPGAPRARHGLPLPRRAGRQLRLQGAEPAPLRPVGGRGRDGHATAPRPTMSSPATPGPRFEGLRVFDVTNPVAPVHLASVPTRCGSHTHTTDSRRRRPAADRLRLLEPRAGAARRSARSRTRRSRSSRSRTSNPAEARLLKEQPLHFDTQEHFHPGGISAGVACHEITAFLHPHAARRLRVLPERGAALGHLRSGEPEHARRAHAHRPPGRPVLALLDVHVGRQGARCRATRLRSAAATATPTRTGACGSSASWSPARRTRRSSAATRRSGRTRTPASGTRRTSSRRRALRRRRRRLDQRHEHLRLHRPSKRPGDRPLRPERRRRQRRARDVVGVLVQRLHLRQRLRARPRRLRRCAATNGRPYRARHWHHLNPQTQESFQAVGLGRVTRIRRAAARRVRATMRP